MDDINIFEASYVSSNKKHLDKRREVALYLLGSFAEDLSMYKIRNPDQFDLHTVVEGLILLPDAAQKLKSLLRGR